MGSGIFFSKSSSSRRQRYRPTIDVSPTVYTSCPACCADVVTRRSSCSVAEDAVADEAATDDRSLAAQDCTDDAAAAGMASVWALAAGPCCRSDAALPPAGASAEPANHLSLREGTLLPGSNDGASQDRFAAAGRCAPPAAVPTAASAFSTAAGRAAAASCFAVDGAACCRGASKAGNSGCCCLAVRGDSSASLQGARTTHLIAPQKPRRRGTGTLQRREKTSVKS